MAKRGKGTPDEIGGQSIASLISPALPIEQVSFWSSFSSVDDKTRAGIAIRPTMTRSCYYDYFNRRISGCLGRVIEDCIINATKHKFGPSGRLHTNPSGDTDGSPFLLCPGFAGEKIQVRRICETKRLESPHPALSPQSRGEGKS
jgi:hypothetical protein